MSLIRLTKGKKMTSNTLITREEAIKLIDTLQGEALLGEIDKLLAQINTLKEVKESYTDKYWKASAEIGNLREKVRNYFKDELDGDKEASVEMELDDINDLLNRIGAEEIKFTYSAEVTITFTITGVEADSEEDAKSKILDAISYQVSSSLDHDNTEDDNYEVDNVEAE
jgi:hypothetical protein